MDGPVTLHVHGGSVALDRPCPDCSAPSVSWPPPGFRTLGPRETRDCEIGDCTGVAVLVDTAQYHAVCLDHSGYRVIPAASRFCSTCHGTGYVPTDHGRAVLAFLARHQQGALV